VFLDNLCHKRHLLVQMGYRGDNLMLKCIVRRGLVLRVLFIIVCCAFPTSGTSVIRAGGVFGSTVRSCQLLHDLYFVYRGTKSPPIERK